MYRCYNIKSTLWIMTIYLNITFNPGVPYNPGSPLIPFSPGLQPWQSPPISPFDPSRPTFSVIYIS